MITMSTRNDMARLLDSIKLAFVEDPVFRWMYPEPSRFLAKFDVDMRLYGGRAFDHGGAYHLEDFVGGALWLPPGIYPDEAGLDAFLQDNFDGPMRDDVFSMFERVGAFHPAEPCWHLAYLAVDPTHRGKKYGSALLEYGLALCDRDRMPAYLESTNPKNLTLYERYGFELVGEAQAGASPSMFAMLRTAK